jgi:hypothetical protein
MRGEDRELNRRTDEQGISNVEGEEESCRTDEQGFKNVEGRTD